jgi:acyl-coenzyme A thioesterase PaaI-like protein
MDVTRLPFNRLIGLEPATPDGGFLVGLPDGPQYTNHLGTVHASALVAVAEAGSGEFLARHLGDGGDAAGFVPVVRRLESKFRKPASGRVWARASVPPEQVQQWSEELASRGRVSCAVPVEVVDTSGVVVLSAVVEWFIARGRSDTEPGAAPAPTDI